MDGNNNLVYNDMLKACLAQQTNGLAVMWDLPNRYGPWAFSTKPLGDALGPALQATLRSPGSPSVRSTFILGDPTLRFAQVLPPGTPVPSSGVGGVVLNWTASGTAGAGYWVYATTNLTAPNWTRLTAGAPLSTPRYTNIGASGTIRYMIRAVALQATGSGSYTNLSQGTFVTYP